MKVHYESCKDIFDEEKGFGENCVKEMLEALAAQILAYSNSRRDYYKNAYGIDLIIHFDELRAVQAVVDALEDLLRIKQFHTVIYPNKLKYAAYLSYWWLQRQPLMFSINEKDKEKFFKVATKEDVARIVNVNAHWLVAFVMSMIFSEKQTVCAQNKAFVEAWVQECNYIYYYFCYRAISPKSIEAFLSTAIMHPIWEVREGIKID